MKDTKWKPGQSGNPKGRPPKDRCVTDAMRRLMRERKIGGKEMAEILAENLLKRALKSSSDLSLVLDRTEGKVPQNVAFDPNMPLVVNVNRIVAHVSEDGGNGDSDTD